LRLKACVISKAGRAPFELYLDICFTTQEKHVNSQARRVATGILFAPHWLSFRRRASSCLLHFSSPRLLRGHQSDFGRHKCLTNYRNKGSPHQLN
jgi:hypothetical protein